MKSAGFKESGADSCVFIQSGQKDLKIIAVYVDDLILIAKTLGEIQQMKEGLSKTFKMKDMGQLRYCLGINFELTMQTRHFTVSEIIFAEVIKYKLHQWIQTLNW